MTNEGHTVLVVDDDPAVAHVLSALLEQAQIACRRAKDVTEAIVRLESELIDVIVSDIQMPGQSGMEFLALCRERWPDVPVIMLTAHGSVADAVNAMRLGAQDFILKPFDRQEILFVIKKAIATLASRDTDGKQMSTRADVGLVGQSPAMNSVRKMIDRVGQSDATVLLRGENGTGKEVVAHALHMKSPRRDHPFVAVRCAAIPDSLLESELFGYEKGAFTGAVARKPGRIELAQGGTVFLDEIGDLSPTMQVKLLHVLEARQLERLGGTETVHLDVRFLAATHRDLETMVSDGRFREDLFYRLNVVPLLLPPLRARPSDVKALAEHFLTAVTALNNKKGWSLAPEASAHLERQPWPGNVRQLRNVVERLVVLSDGPVLGVDDVRRELERDLQRDRVDGSTPQDIAAFEDQRKAIERSMLEETLKRCDDNRTKAARILGLSRRTLYNKLEKHGLT